MAISMIVPVLIFAILVCVVVAVVSAKSEYSEGGEDVIKNAYVYLVLFATLMMVIGGSVSAFMAAADILVPTPYYQSFEDYKRFEMERKDMTGSEQDSVKLTEEELREKYDDMVRAEKEKQILRAKNSLIKSFGWIVIPLPVFIYYQKNLVKKTA
ncbi:hypothetical protein JT739_02080 [Tepidanaerobacter sp. GT38]|uniref:hypothetical protein n=1 Tax=Tepidanaerobacter sp. GT38 TaxID=2722793 RepID=UPI001F2D16AB|nr:hypothetical protein [Tepidanaerobacter sp. GT38]MCG1011378.1 hypothetical protein [Tepidanaerobacter sp. GT38]